MDERGIPKKEDKRGHPKEGRKILKEIRKLREITKKRENRSSEIFGDELKKKIEIRIND